MSESISPWISSYFISLAEKHGGDMASMPRYTKKRKTQLVEFLTYGQDDIIWARISDKEYLCPIRFSYDAVQSYTSRSGSRLTQLKTAIIVISDFKASLSRIPQGNGSMSQDSFLMLDCYSFTVLGSLGESKYGDPKPLEFNNDLLEWTRGLRQHGGGGNFLRDRKKEAAKDSPSDSLVPRPLFPKPETAPFSQVALKQAKSNPIVARIRPTTPKKGSSTSCRYQETWPIAKKSSFRRPPDDVASILACMKVDSSSSSDAESKKSESFDQAEPSRKRRRVGSTSLSPPTTPSSKSRSRSATPLIDEWPASELQPDESPSPETRSSQKGDLPSPGISSPVQNGGIEIALSSPPPRSDERKEPARDLSSTSPLLPSVPSNTSIAPEFAPHLPSTESPSSHARRQVIRKVPRPPQPARPPQSLHDPIILVPNSDISTSYSLSQSQSQSQSQSHRGSQIKAVVNSESNPISQQSPLTQSQDNAGARSRVSSPNRSSEARNHGERLAENHDHPTEAQTRVENGQMPQPTDRLTEESSVPRATITNAQKSTDIPNNSLFSPRDLVKVSPRTHPTTTQPEKAEVVIPADEGPQSDEVQPMMHVTSEPPKDGVKVNSQDQENSKVPPAPNATIAITRVSPIKIDMQPHEHGVGIPEQVTATGRDAGSEGKSQPPPINLEPAEVEHDADLWAAPSFLQRSISKTVVSKNQSEPVLAQTANKSVPPPRTLRSLAPQALQESRLLNGLPIQQPSQYTKAQGDKTISRSMATEKRVSRHDSVDNNQNNEPIGRAKRPSETHSQRDIVSNPSSDNTKVHRTKKRKRPTDATVVETTSRSSLAERGAPTSSHQRSQQETRRLVSLLPPWDLDNIILEEQSQPLLSWEMLLNTLRLVEQDRMEDSLDA